MLLIKNGKVITMTGTIFEKGDILIENGKIVVIGQNIEANCKTIDATNKWVVPGFIEAHCHIGMQEPFSGEAGDDVNEMSEPITPQLNAIDAVNTFEPSFKEALKAGITTVCTGPGSANVIGGTFCILKTHGKNIFDMAISEKAAMKAALGENPKRVYGKKNKMPSTRMATAFLLREALTKAITYNKKKLAAKAKEEIFELDLKLEALLPVINKQMPLKLHVHRADDIITALRIRDEFSINITLDHCSEGTELIEEIKNRNIPVVVGPTMTFKGKVETKNKSFKTAGEMQQSGILTAITTDHPVTCIEFLPVCAGLCVRAGMDVFEALKAITINPAKILGIDRIVGSIEVGKDADIVIASGNPLEVLTTINTVIVNGEIAYEEE